MRAICLVCCLSLMLVACGEDEPEAPASTAAEATEEPAEEPAEEPPPARTRPPVSPDGRPTANIDTAESSLTWTGRKITGSEEGSFGEWTGVVRYGEDVTSTSIEVTIQTNSLTASSERLATHLKSADFFDVEQFPTARFSTSQIVARDGEGGTHTVTGRLTLHGVSRAITFPATITVDAQGLRANAEIAIDRQDFGITYPGMPDDLIQDEVGIRFEVQAPRE